MATRSHNSPHLVDRGAQGAQLDCETGHHRPMQNAMTQPSDDPSIAPANEWRRGWGIVVAAALGVGVGLTGLPFYSFGVFVKPLEAAFGWSRAEVTTGMLFLSLGSVLTGPLIGMLIDRIGVRAVALPSLLGLALGFVFLAWSGPTLATFYAAWAALALLGCGTTPLTWTRAINLNFDRMRGLALGTALLGTGFASIFGPLLQGLIAARGWQAGYLAIALFIAIVALPAAYFGLPRTSSVTTRPTPASGAGVSWGDAVKTSTFVKIAASIFLMILAQSSATVHFVPLLEDRGIAAADAAATAGLLGLSIVVGRILVGYLVDRIHGPYVAALFFGLPALALLLLLTGEGIGVARGAAILLGLAAGAEVDLLAFLISRYFGLRHYGAIYGTALSIFGLGAAMGAPLTSLALASYGTYTIPLVIGILAFIAGALIISSLGAYRTEVGSSRSA